MTNSSERIVAVRSRDLDTRFYSFKDISSAVSFVKDVRKKYPDAECIIGQVV